MTEANPKFLSDIFERSQELLIKVELMHNKQALLSNSVTQSCSSDKFDKPVRVTFNSHYRVSRMYEGSKYFSTESVSLASVSKFNNRVSILGLCVK